MENSKVLQIHWIWNEKLERRETEINDDEVEVEVEEEEERII